MFNRATSLGTALTAGYRSDGMRAWKQDSSGNRTYYLYDGDSPVQEMDASGNYKAEFVYGPAGLISHNRAGLGTVFFAYDDGGDVQSVFSSTGSLISSRVYDAYGAQAGGIVADATHDDPEIGYNGQSGYTTDPETSLVLCGHRYYDPSAGRWLNRDPIGYAGGTGLYNYCANNPDMGVDTSGFAADPCGYDGGGGMDPVLDAALDDRIITNTRGRTDRSWDRADRAFKAARDEAGEFRGDYERKYEKLGPGKYNTLVGERTRGPNGRGWYLDEGGDHVNWYDWSKGHKGDGGRSGHEWYPKGDTTLPRPSADNSGWVRTGEWQSTQIGIGPFGAPIFEDGDGGAGILDGEVGE